MMDQKKEFTNHFIFMGLDLNISTVMLILIVEQVLASMVIVSVIMDTTVLIAKTLSLLTYHVDSTRCVTGTGIVTKTIPVFVTRGITVPTARVTTVVI